MIAQSQGIVIGVGAGPVGKEAVQNLVDPLLSFGDLHMGIVIDVTVNANRSADPLGLDDEFQAIG
jgi:hypothetical protein